MITEFKDKLIERLEELKNNRFKVGSCDNYDCYDADDDCTTCYLQRVSEIINQLAEEYETSNTPTWKQNLLQKFERVD